MSEFDQLYREVILDHLQKPVATVDRGRRRTCGGTEPLCGDEVSIFVAFGEDGDTIDEVKFSGRGCAISQAATSMLRRWWRAGARRRSPRCHATRCSSRDRIPLTRSHQVALLGLIDAQAGAAQGEGTPLPEEWAGAARTSSSRSECRADVWPR